jgi:hypothetical protein
MVIWKRIKTRFTNLIKLGVRKAKVWEYANTGKGYRHTRQQPDAKYHYLERTIETNRLHILYRLLFQSIPRKLKNRRVPNGTHGGVGGQNRN